MFYFRDMLKLCSKKWIQLANKNYVNNVLRSSRGYSLSQISLKKYDDRRRQPSLIPYTEVDSSENHRYSDFTSFILEIHE